MTFKAVMAAVGAAGRSMGRCDLFCAGTSGDCPKRGRKNLDVLEVLNAH